MICDVCKERDAVVQLTQVAGSAPTTLHLCEKCAAERGIETTISMAKYPLDFIQAVQKQLPATPADLRCDFCQATLSDFRSSGRLGCARCYTAFEASLRDLLRRVQGNSKHIGKRYLAPEPVLAPEASMLFELRERLRRAIAEEHFEQAAKLRDQIKVME
ncbi:MAG: UvrB/UvrC motif-containing protein [Gemmatimonadaceae bacterium]